MVSGLQFGPCTGTFRVCIMDEREQGFVQLQDETCIV